MSLTTQNNFDNQSPAPFQPPPRPGAIARTFALVKSLAGGGFVLMLLVGAAEFLFAPQFKPSVLFGSFWGHVETQEILAKREATVDLTQRTAAAAAKAQADAAKQAEILGNTEGVKGFAAQVTDLACLAGQFIGTSRDPETRSTGKTWQQACGVSDRIRDSMARDVTGQGAGAGAGAGTASPPPPPPQPQSYALQPEEFNGAQKFRPYDPPSR